MSISAEKLAYIAQWKREHPDRVRESNIRCNARVKHEVILHYSNGTGACACGYSNIDALTLDHIADDGAEYRRNGGLKGGTLYRRLRKLGFPPGFQVLCANCNLIKEIQRRR